MSTLFPNALDQYATVPENQQVAVQHRSRHQNMEDAMEAVQGRVGVTNSAVITTHDYRIRLLENALVVGTSWVENAVPVGLADGTLGQVVLGPQTLLGRTSASAAVAQPCTDYAFSLFIATTAAAARTVLGAGTVTSVGAADATGITWTGSPVTGSGTLTPTLSANLQAWSGIATSAKQDTDATLTALAGQNWAANALPIGSGADTMAQVTFSANTFPARSSTGNLVAKPLTDAALSILDDATVGAILTTIGGQPLDATLTALAGVNWAANSLAIGSGTDTVAQVTFAANTYPARTSTGNLVAKTITDSAAAALAVAVSGTYTPVLTNIANVSTSTMAVATWMRVNDVITVFGTMNLTPTAVVDTQFRITLPVASALANATEAAGTFCNIDTSYTAGAIFANVANDAAEFRFIANSTANRVITYHFSYRVI